MTESWLGYLPSAGLILARCAGVCALSPPVSWMHFPPLLRIGVAAALTAPLTLVLAPDLPTQSLAPVTYLGLLLSNLLVGLILGGGLWLLLEAFRAAGHLADQWSLSGSGEDVTEGLLSGFLYLVALIFFVQLNGLQWLLMFLRQSCQVIPLAASVELTATGVWLQWPGLMLVTALRVTAPLVLALLLAGGMTAALAQVVGETTVGPVAPAVRHLLLLVTIGALVPLLGGLILGELDHWARELGAALSWLRG